MKLAIQTWVLLFAFFAAHSFLSFQHPLNDETPPPIEDSFNALLEPTNSNYVDDELCGMCHKDIYDSYQEIGMAQSFYRPGGQPFIEDFENNSYFHEPSNRMFKMVKKEGELFFQRYQPSPDGKPINFYERKVDWILGSGNKSRTYLFQTESNEMFQFPLAWYTKINSWRLAPGFEKHNGMALGRQILRECMFCHSAYPENIEEANGLPWEMDAFSHDLPQGIGCQRCHGPGKEHVQLVINSSDRSEIAAAIVNPSKLAPDLRDDVCNQCHLQPAIVLMGPRRFDKNDYSFRPGTPLSDYLLHVEIEEEGRTQEERFEINHHPYRLYQSECFIKSEGELSCISCHDPHKKLNPEAALTHYRDACLECHQAHEKKTVPKHFAHIAEDDCASCHMPQHRTQDVVEVVVTDHLIRKSLPLKDWTARVSNKKHYLKDIAFLEPEEAPKGALGDAYLAVAAVRANGPAYVIDYLKHLLATEDIPEISPYFDLAKGQLRIKRYEEVLETTDKILKRIPDSELAMMWRGIAQIRTVGVEVAIESFKKAVAINPLNPNPHYNLGLGYQMIKDYQKAIEALKTALALRENFSTASLHLAQCYLKLDKKEEALKAYQQTLSIEPSNTKAYIEIGELLFHLDKEKEAIRFWRHGLKVAKEPNAIQEVALKAGIELD